MKVITGNFYFISDKFFEKINDPYLKINYEHTKRPHYFAIQDKKTGLLWLVPCSSKIEKFEKIISKRQNQSKPTDTIKIVKIQGKKSALLLQDMFPIKESYIVDEYTRRGELFRIANPDVIKDIEHSAKKVIMLLRKGVKFTPTQPDAIRIEKIMLDELALEKSELKQNNLEPPRKPNSTLNEAISGNVRDDKQQSSEASNRLPTLSKLLSQAKQKAGEINQTRQVTNFFTQTKDKDKGLE